MFTSRRRLKVLIRAGMSVLAVSVVALPACTSGGGHPRPGPSSSGGFSGVKITSITATPVNAGEIDLQWVVSGKAPGFDIRRNGSYLDAAMVTSYRDTGLKPKQSYTYEVMVQDSKGRDGPPTSVTATTPKSPPLSKARLSGSYGVRLVFTAENYVNRQVGSKYSEKWKLKAKCPSGACSALLVTNVVGSKSGVLAQKGSTYSGSVTDTLDTCQGKHYPEKVTITLHVTRASFLHGEWTATSFSGTTSNSAPAAGGCVSSSSKSSMKGRRL